MIRDLLFVASGTSGDPHALSGAIALAKSLDAHLAVLETVSLPMPMPSPWGITPDALLGEVYVELRGRSEGRAAGMREELQRQGVQADVRVVEARFIDPPQVIAAHARHADLSVLTAANPSEPDDAGIVGSIFNGLLFGSGRPVLMLPSQHAVEAPFRHAVVAWRPTREASRALHDSLPLLEQAGSVDVVTVEEAGLNEEAMFEGADIAAHLARHGVKANVVVRPQQRGETVATALLRHAADSDAQLLVAGGYGHSRLRQWVLGGTTRELMHAISVPILFSH